MRASRENFVVRKNEQGVALIFTLSILALLLMIMMAFASSMILKRKLSSNMANQEQLKMLTETATNRAMMQMRIIAEGANQSAIEHYYDFNKVVSFDNKFDDTKPDERQILVQEQLNIKSLSNPNDASDVENRYDIEKAGEVPEWVYAIDPATNKAVGRYSYAVIPEYNFLAYEDMFAEAQPAEYEGKGLNDIDFDSLKIKTSGAGYPATDRSTASNVKAFQQLVAVGSYSDKDVVDEAGPYFDRFVTFNPQGSEKAFRAVKDGYTEDSLYARYDMSTTPFSGKIVADLVETDWGNISDFKTSASSLVFFKKFVNNNDSTFANGTDWANQIAANIIDYTKDENDEVTSNVDLSEWEWDNSSTPAPPLYTGNKKSFYLNEFTGYVEITFDSSEQFINVSEKRVTVEFELKFVPDEIEIIDVYGIDFEDYNVSLWVDTENAASLMVENSYLSEETFQFEFKDEASGGEESGFHLKDITPNAHIFAASFEKAETIYIDTENKIGIPGTFSVAKEFSFRCPITDSPSISYEVQNLEFDVYIKLTRGEYSAAKAVDFAKLHLIANNASGTVGTDSTVKLIFNMSVEDPRQNLNEGDWVSSNASTLGQENGIVPASNTYDPNGDYDPENYAGGIKAQGEDNPSLSTAYIREADMTSLAELGYIHRGVKWQTINLKKSPDVTDLTAISSADYANGDAEILDMVHLGEDKTRIQLSAIHPETEQYFILPHEDLLKAWLSQSRLELENFANPDVSAKGSLTGIGLEDALKNLYTNMPTISANNFIVPAVASSSAASGTNNRLLAYKRSALADIFSEKTSASLTAPFDTALEALAGKTINLVDAGQFPNMVQLVVVAQTFKGPVTKGYETNSQIASSRKSLITITRTADNVFKVIDVKELDISTN